MSPAPDRGDGSDGGGILLDQPEAGKKRRSLSTSKFVFLVLTIALAPLGALAMGASTQSMRANDADRQALLAIAADFAGRRLNRIITNDAISLQAAIKAAPTTAETRPAPDPAPINPDTATAQDMRDAALAQSAGTAPVATINRYAAACAAVSQALPGGPNLAFARIIDRRTGRDLCVGGVPADQDSVDEPIGAARIDEAGKRLIYSVTTTGDNGRIEIVYPLGSLGGLLPDEANRPINRLSLITATDNLTLIQHGGDTIIGLGLESRAPVGRTGMITQVSAARTWLKPADLVSLLTPLGMWLLAVLLSWLLVDRILLNPIQQLRRRMAEYHPGDRMPPMKRHMFVAREIVALDDMTQKLATNVADDKAALASALDVQRALTREVHHRVKNNLQIVASLISLHSRDASSESETRAYRAIQRRVDALAVVHRHLHAEREDHSGVALGTILSELLVALRHSLAVDGRPVEARINVMSARAIEDVALPAAFFVTELVELAVQVDGTAPVTIDLFAQDGHPTLATLRVAGPGLVDCADRLGSRYNSYERVLTGLARQLRQPLVVDDIAGHYCITISLLG